MKIQSKIIITTVSLQLVLLISFGITIYYFLEGYIDNSFRIELEHRANVNEKILLEKNIISKDEYKKTLNEYVKKLSDEKIYHIKSSLISDSILSIAKVTFPEKFVSDLLNNKSSYYSSALLNLYGKEYKVNGEEWMIIISAKDIKGFNLLYKLKNIIIVGIFTISILIFIASYFLARSILNPITRKIQTAMKISSNNLYQRIEIENPNDEIGQLAIAFNRMLHRLEESFKLQSSFISNASHEINNPLTIISGTAEIALLKDRSIEEYKETLESILQDSDFLNSLVSQLFNLAKTNANFEKLPKEDFYLLDIIEVINTQNKKLYPDIVKIITSNNSQNAKIYGNKDLLISAINNLIDNAVKFSGRKDVVLETKRTANTINITITDNGPGVDKLELEKITSAFYRSEKVREIKGHGIGLALTEKIINLHNGSILFKNKKISSGLSVIVNLPLIN